MIQANYRTDNIEQWIDLRNRLLMIKATTTETDRILEVGSGLGELTNLLRIHNRQVYGSDKSLLIEGIPWDITKRFPSLPCEFDWVKPPYDYVICSHVLEHIEIPLVSRALQNLRSILEYQGRVFLELPSRRSLVYALVKFGRLKGFGSWGFLKRFTPNPTHKFEISRDYPYSWILDILYEIFGVDNVTRYYPIYPLNSVYFICSRKDL